MVVAIPGVIRMSAINTTNNDVVFAIGANGYSTVGVDNPA
jgi:DNA-binding MurR/RpiR family transcriptional regulator